MFYQFGLKNKFNHSMNLPMCRTKFHCKVSSRVKETFLGVESIVCTEPCYKKLH